MKTEFDHFVTLLENDELVEGYFEKVLDDANYPQIKRIHAMFRMLSQHSGYTVDETKMRVKESCGWAYAKTIDGEPHLVSLKSIGDMSKIELSELIEGTMRYAETNFSIVLD